MKLFRIRKEESGKVDGALNLRKQSAGSDCAEDE